MVVTFDSDQILEPLHELVEVLRLKFGAHNERRGGWIEDSIATFDKRHIVFIVKL